MFTVGSGQEKKRYTKNVKRILHAKVSTEFRSIWRHFHHRFFETFYSNILAIQIRQSRIHGEKTIHKSVPVIKLGAFASHFARISYDKILLEIIIFYMWNVHVQFLEYFSRVNIRIVKNACVDRWKVFINAISLFTFS